MSTSIRADEPPLTTTRRRSGARRLPHATPLRAWAVVRAAMATGIIAAVVVQLSASISTATELGKDVLTTITNFFSFFTVLSNLAAAIVLLWAASHTLRVRRDAQEPLPLAVALAAVTTFMIITGVVYNVLLRGVELPQGSAPVPWSNEVLHLIAPLFMVVDLLLVRTRRRLPWHALWVVLAFPVAWATYTLVRGPLVTNPTTLQPYWYPYPFLDPNGSGGWGSVAMYVVAITAVFVIVGAGVVAWKRRVPRAHP